jgi:hypothetical protein
LKYQKVSKQHTKKRINQTIAKIFHTVWNNPVKTSPKNEHARESPHRPQQIGEIILIYNIVAWNVNGLTVRKRSRNIFRRSENRKSVEVRNPLYKIKFYKYP